MNMFHIPYIYIYVYIRHILLVFRCFPHMLCHHVFCFLHNQTKPTFHLRQKPSSPRPCANSKRPTLELAEARAVMDMAGSLVEPLKLGVRRRRAFCVRSAVVRAEKMFFGSTMFGPGFSALAFFFAKG